MLQRVYYFNEDLDKADKGLVPHNNYDMPQKENIKEVDEKSNANLVSSKIKGTEGFHVPTLDIDAIPCRLYESKTPGHYHLMIDKPMPWRQYRLLLWILYKVGIIEEGYYDASLKKGATFLRTDTHTEDHEVTREKKHPSMTWQ